MYKNMEAEKSKRTILKKILGVALIIIGILALLTPFTPGSWLAFIGLELLGIRLMAWDRIKKYLKPRQ